MRLTGVMEQELDGSSVLKPHLSHEADVVLYPSRQYAVSIPPRCLCSHGTAVIRGSAVCAWLYASCMPPQCRAGAGAPVGQLGQSHAY
jgi:hypothetical protein